MAASSFQFLHAADIHLDSPLRGLSLRGAEAAAFTGASRQALDNLVSTAIAEKVAFVVIAGDIYDGDWRDFSTGHVFVRQMGRLARENIPVFMLRGNHDALSVISRDLPLPENVHNFSVRKVESVELPEIGVVLHGRGFAHRHVPENMALAYPPAREGQFNIGVLHTSLTGREGHEVYAPCTVADLERTGYDYWALGHIHQREVVRPQGPAIVFPGNLQGRHARETGAKGATLVRVVDGRIADMIALTLDAARFASLNLDLTGLSSPADLHGRLRVALAEAVEQADGRPLAVRLTLTGRTPLADHLRADPGQLREDVVALAAAAGDQVLVEKVSIRVEAPPTAMPAQLADFEQILAEVTADPAVRADIGATIRDLYGKAPKPVLKALGLDEADLEAVIAEALAEGEQAIIARLRDPAGEGSAS
ncbi:MULTISPECIES: metallophosphoesterase family protein [unclassified Xanthobacter]|uniref:metallophosphoesterase family protein n=1 Tax=unclassified Xanthobacter TaxID=2623496 RepID=UPI001EDF3AA7|nr:MULTISPECIES: DNA repair exonuclease [unclassified Xanthobacter]